MSTRLRPSRSTAGPAASRSSTSRRSSAATRRSPGPARPRRGRRADQPARPGHHRHRPAQPARHAGRAPRRRPMIVVVRAPRTAPVGLLVDQIGDVIETDEPSFESPPDTVTAAGARADPRRLQARRTTPARPRRRPRRRRRLTPHSPPTPRPLGPDSCRATAAPVGNPSLTQPGPRAAARRRLAGGRRRSSSGCGGSSPASPDVARAHDVDEAGRRLRSTRSRTVRRTPRSELKVAALKTLDPSTTALRRRAGRGQEDTATVDEAYASHADAQGDCERPEESSGRAIEPAWTTTVDLLDVYRRRRRRDRRGTIVACRREQAASSRPRPTTCCASETDFEQRGRGRGGRGGTQSIGPTHRPASSL